jgi:peptidyl-prolyl cis-trans isomerase B (cyclophilin B)
MKRVLTLLFILSFVITAIAQKPTKPSKTDYVITIKTKFGDMVALLYDETPKHKANFIKLAKEHFYDSTLFHRVISEFMIQGGDPDSKKAKPGDRLGSGGPSYTVEAEFNPKFIHEKGALSAARQGDNVNPTKASSGSQFYIVQGKKFTEDELKTDPQRLNACFAKFFENPANKPIYDSLGKLYQAQDRENFDKYLKSLKPKAEAETGLKTEKDISPEQVAAYTQVGGAPHLDGSYTVFGKVIKGLEVIDKIATQPRDGADRPNEDIRMTITVEELPKKKITKLYGYVYPEVKK